MPAFARDRLMARLTLLSGTFSENEYYGNHTDYAYVAVSLVALYEALFAEGLFA